MACKTCEELQEKVDSERARAVTLREVLDLEREKSEELQEACNRYKEEAAASLLSAEGWERGLQEERAMRASVPELFKVASEAAQIAVLIRKALPVSPASDEAAAVALAALKQVRERLEEGANKAGGPG